MAMLLVGCSSNPDAAIDAAQNGQDATAPDARVTDATPPADACPVCPATPVFVNYWGGYGTEPGQFVEPSSVELLSSGIVVVAGHENRVQRFTQDGELIDIFGTAGSGDGQFNHPHGLAVDRTRGDTIYVGDQENGRLQVFTADGAFIRQWGDAGFAHIHDVGIDISTGNVFVGDYELDTLRKFSPTGELLANYGGTGTEPGKFNGVWGISTDSSGNVYVADTFNRRVQKFDVNGTFLTEWNSYAGTLFSKPTGVFVDSADVVYVCDSTARSLRCSIRPARFFSSGTSSRSMENAPSRKTSSSTRPGSTSTSPRSSSTGCCTCARFESGR